MRSILVVGKFWVLRSWVFSGAWVGVTLLAVGAEAQQDRYLPRAAYEVPRGETITTRPRPELDPLGMRFGGFLFYPKLGVGEEYDDNIFRVEGDKEDDLITVITPEVSLRSDWANHSLNFEADATIGRYAESSDEDYEDFTVRADGRLDITRNNYLFGALEHTQFHEDRGSPDDVAGTVPTEFTISNASVTYFHRFNRLSFTVEGTAREINFDDVPAIGGTINNDDRDRKDFIGTVRVAYEIVPEYEAFFRGGVNARPYDDAVDDNGFDRDSDGYEVVIGTAVDLSGVTFGDVFVGFASQDYEDPQLPTIDGVTFGGTIYWNVTRLTTITGSIRRTIEESTLSGASGFFATRVGVSVDHELLRNLLLSGDLHGTRSDYEGIDREDDDIQVGLGAKYLLNRHLYLSLDYSYWQRESSQAGGGDRDFKQNRVIVGLETQL